MCADFDAMLRHDWRRLGISAEEVREFCVWRNAPMRVLSSQGDLVDSYDPALKEHRTVCFLAFDGHCYMYRAVKRVLERQAARVLYRGEARQTLPPIQEWRRFDAADVQPGLFWCGGGAPGSESCRRSTRCCGGGARRWGRSTGAGLAHEIFLKLLKAKREVPAQALCGDCHSEKTLRESAQPREPRGPQRHGVRPEPQAASSRL